MSVSEILRCTKETLFSFEVLPPLRGKSLEQIYDTIDRLIVFNPAFIEVTTHRSDYVPIAATMSIRSWPPDSIAA